MDMSERGYEKIRIEPLLCLSNTAAASEVRKIKWGDESKMLFTFGVGGAAVAGGVISATATSIVQFTLTESTASTAAGSAITGATMSLGCSTAYVVRNAEAIALTLTSVVSTTGTFSVNGYSYHCTAVDAATTGEGVASALAAAINGSGTFEKLPHYRAYANFGATGVVLIAPDDGYGTGLTCATANATNFKPRVTKYFGAIELRAEALSTVSPKYIGCVVTTYAGASCIRTAEAIRFPSAKPAFAGVTTFV
jgi:hypothetical protein